MVAVAAVKNKGLHYNLEIIGNPNRFIDFNVTKSPAMLIDGKIVVEGFVPTLEEITSLFSMPL